MRKTDVPLRIGWFGYRKKDVEACIEHLCAVHAAENRLTREHEREMEGIMAQIRQENRVLRQRLAQQTAMQVTAFARTDGVRVQDLREQMEQLDRKLAAARAEVRRYQTRLFACERQMLALRHENAELEAACEQAREEVRQASERAERAEQALQAAEKQPAAERQEPLCVTAPPEAPVIAEPESAQAAPEPPRQEPEQKATPMQAPPEEAVWQPKTALERLSVELLNRFDEMMAECGAV